MLGLKTKQVQEPERRGRGRRREGEKKINNIEIISTYRNCHEAICEPQVQIRGSIVVSISACHAEDPGSIPGRGGFSR